MAKMRHYKRSMSGVKFGSRTKIFNYLFTRIMLEYLVSFFFHWSQSFGKCRFVVSILWKFAFNSFFPFSSCLFCFLFVILEALFMIEFIIVKCLLFLRILSISFIQSNTHIIIALVTCSENVTRQVHKLWNAWRNKSEIIILFHKHFYIYS